MVQSQRMTNFLARNEIPPRSGVVGRGVEVRVVQFHRTLGDVFARDPNLRNSQPAVIAISAVAYFNATAGWTAVPVSGAGHYDSVKYSRLAPIRSCSAED